MNINQNYFSLKDSYLFSLIGKKVKEYTAAHPDAQVIRLGIGDVTQPLIPAVIDAMQQAVAEMSHAKTFRGYGEDQGYGFLRQAICGYYGKKGVTLREDEIFVSDGAKSDLGNILDIFSPDNTVLIPNPVYPVYVDTNLMAGRKILYTNGNSDNGFLPLPNENVHADIIYLCSPNNPTGGVYTKAQLQLWVDYARENHAVILFDSAYEAFIQDSSLPTSIYQIPGAETCAIEFCSLSKTAGFTGTRCGYTIVPHGLVHDDVSLNSLWLRRQTTKFNGVSYIIQRGAEAVFSDAGLMQSKEQTAYYLQNAHIISDALRKLGIWFIGGDNSPYLWLQCPDGLSSWEFFDHLLQTTHIVGTPGSGFGSNGEGFFRLTAFGERANIMEAAQRLRGL